MTNTEPNKGRVLVVDDDDDCCAALRILLQREGFDVDVATSGAAALAQIASRPPEVVLSDIRMPGMDGFALLRAARLKSECPVILMSGDGKNEAEVMRAGAFGYIGKPLEIDVVVRALEDAVALRRSHA